MSKSYSSKCVACFVFRQEISRLGLFRQHRPNAEVLELERRGSHLGPQPATKVLYQLLGRLNIRDQPLRAVANCRSSAVAEMPNLPQPLAPFRGSGFGELKLLHIVAQLVLLDDQQIDDRAPLFRAEKNVSVQEADALIDVGAGDKPVHGAHHKALSAETYHNSAHEINLCASPQLRSSARVGGPPLHSRQCVGRGPLRHQAWL